MIKTNRGFFYFRDQAIMSADDGSGDGGGGGSGDDGGGGSGDGGGGGAGGDDKTFTQADLNRMVANERRSNQAKMDTLQASADKVPGLETTIQEAKEAKELADADAAGQATILAQRQADQHQAKLEEKDLRIAGLEADKAAGDTRLTDFQTRTTIGQELAKAGMLGAAAKHAIPAMMADSEVTLNEDGSIATIKLDKVMQADLATAVAQFLTDNPHFKAAPPGGSGSGAPNGGAGGSDKPIAEMSQQERWAAARQRK